MAAREIRCIDCKFCDVEHGICTLKTREVTVDAVRKCKLALKIVIRLQNLNRSMQDDDRRP